MKALEDFQSAYFQLRTELYHLKTRFDSPAITPGTESIISTRIIAVQTQLSKITEEFIMMAKANIDLIKEDFNQF